MDSSKRRRRGAKPTAEPNRLGHRGGGVCALGLNHRKKSLIALANEKAGQKCRVGMDDGHRRIHSWRTGGVYGVSASLMSHPSPQSDLKLLLPSAHHEFTTACSHEANCAAQQSPSELTNRPAGSLAMADHDKSQYDFLDDADEDQSIISVRCVSRAHQIESIGASPPPCRVVCSRLQQ